MAREEEICKSIFGTFISCFKKNKLEQKTVDENISIKSEFFNEICNNYKQVMNGNSVIIRNLIENINDNMRKFSILGYCGLSVVINTNYSETAPPSVFESLKNHYNNQGFIVFIGHNFIKIYWEEIENINYVHYNSATAKININI